MIDPVSLTDPQVARVVDEYEIFVRAHHEGWEVRRKGHSDPDSERARVARSLDVLGLEDDVDMFMRRVHPSTNLDDITFVQFLDAYVVSMRRDMRECLTEEQGHFLKKVHLRFLPTGHANAHCVDADLAGAKVPFFVVFINEGLYFALNQLFTGLILEELQGELTDYRRDGDPAFEAAIRLFLEPLSTNIDAVPLDLGQDEATGEVQAHLSSVTTIVLLFVSLHEFAHAWLGHHEICDAARLSMLAERASDEYTPKAWDLEYEADAFAFRSLMSRTNTVESQWAHGFVLYLFFAYLSEIERRLDSPLSANHPPPRQRAEAILDTLKVTFPDATHLESDILRLDALITKWTGHNYE